MTVCKVCKQGWQNGGGREVPISAIDVEVALCDAQCLSLDGEAAKLTQTIPAAKRRFVWRRDHGRCTIPGCRAASFIDVHHLVPRAQGGSHEVSNLALLCAGHHRALHDGLIVIEGGAPDFKVIRLTEVPHVGESDGLPTVVTHMGEPAASPTKVPHVGEQPERDAPTAVDPHVIDQVELALLTLGFQRAEARGALARARPRLRADADLEMVLRAALRECPRPAG